MFATAPIIDPREDDAEFPVAEPRIGARNVERSGQLHRAGEPTEYTLGNVKCRLPAIRAGGGPLFSGHEHRVVRDDNVHRISGDANQIDDDLDSVGCLDDVHRNCAFRGRRRFDAGELFEQATEVVVQASTFEEDGGHECILSSLQFPVISFQSPVAGRPHGSREASNPTGSSSQQPRSQEPTAVAKANSSYSRTAIY